MTKFIIHVTPQLPPQNSGVGDYAMLVGRRMEELGDGVVCGYVAGGCNAMESPGSGPHVANITGRCDAESLWQTVERLATPEPSAATSQQGTGNMTVALHYSGYGYERNGCPAWLIDALRNRPASVGRVVTFFHELYATGRPWRRAFWYSARQRRIAAEIAQLSDAMLTNRAASARWLEAQTGRPIGSIPSLSVPSNVGEACTLLPLDRRSAVAVCFGGAKFKEYSLYRNAEKTATICATAGVQQIVDIGQPATVDCRAFADRNIRIEQTGYLPSAAVSDYLASARLAFMEYFPGCLAKSGTIAAFAAHGIPTIVNDASSLPADGLSPGVHYLRLGDACRIVGSADMFFDRLSQIGVNLFHWYQSHNVDAHAQMLYEFATREWGSATCLSSTEARLFRSQS
jgi:hypothetical protein